MEILNQAVDWPYRPDGHFSAEWQGAWGEKKKKVKVFKGGCWIKPYGEYDE